LIKILFPDILMRTDASIKDKYKLENENIFI
jgi:hypothetical protein